MSFHQKLESIQYNAWLAITGAIRSTSKEIIYRELGLELLQLRRWYRKLGMFCKIYQSKSPNTFLNLYLKKFMDMLQETSTTFPFLTLDTTSLKTLSFLPQSLNGTKNFVSKISILKFIRLSSSNAFDCDNHKGIRLIARLRVGLEPFV